MSTTVGSKRFQVNRRTRKEALDKAQELSLEFSSPAFAGSGLRPKEVFEYLQAKELAGGQNLVELVGAYKTLIGDPVETVPVGDALLDWQKALMMKKLSQRYLYSMELWSKKFLGEFEEYDVSQVDSNDVREWLSQWKGRTYNTARGSAQTFFSHCLKRKWIRENPVNEIELQKVVKSEVTVASPAMIRQLLDREMLPKERLYLLISAFAGLRAAEISRLSWKDLRGDELLVEASKAKTGARRLVPLVPWLKEELLKLRDLGVPFPNSRTCQFYVDRWSSIWEHGWKQNILRHSYISYRVALTGDMAAVALEAGNSPQIITSNYRGLITLDGQTVNKALAKEYFKRV